MSDIVTELREKANSSNLAYLKILQKYNFDTTDFHYIFEGYEDQSFYFNFIQHLNPLYETYISLGKKNSIEIYNKLDWTKYDKKRIIIFLDKDYDRLLGNHVPSDNNIYETTFYSVENYICSLSILSRMIREILHFHDSTAINAICAKYIEEYEIFCEKIFPLLVWIYVLRKEEIKANLNMIELSKMYVFDDDLSFKVIKRKFKKEYLERVTNTKTPEIKLSEVRNIKKTFEATDVKNYLRGKYELWFMITFFNKIDLYLKVNYSHKSKVKTNVNLSNSIEILGPRISIPENLAIFLKKM